MAKVIPREYVKRSRKHYDFIKKYKLSKVNIAARVRTSDGKAVNPNTVITYLNPRHATDYPDMDFERAVEAAIVGYLTDAIREISTVFR